MPYWKVEPLTVKEKVETSLPEGWKLRVFRVTHKSTGQPDQTSRHFVQQLLKPASISSLDEVGTDNASATPKQEITICDCLGNLFYQPLAILGIEKHDCTHIKAVRAMTKHV